MQNVYMLFTQRKDYRKLRNLVCNNAAMKRCPAQTATVTVPGTVTVSVPELIHWHYSFIQSVRDSQNCVLWCIMECLYNCIESNSDVPVSVKHVPKAKQGLVRTRVTSCSGVRSGEWQYERMATRATVASPCDC